MKIIWAIIVAAAIGIGLSYAQEIGSEPKGRAAKVELVKKMKDKDLTDKQKLDILWAWACADQGIEVPQ